jgi:hypothetical protein
MNIRKSSETGHPLTFLIRLRPPLLPSILWQLDVVGEGGGLLPLLLALAEVLKRDRSQELGQHLAQLHPEEAGTTVPGARADLRSIDAFNRRQGAFQGGENVQDSDLGRWSREGDSSTGAANRPQQAVGFESGHEVLKVLLGYLLPLGDVFQVNQAFMGVQSHI